MRAICVIASATALAVAQSPAPNATLNELASTRWFAEATEIIKDPDGTTDQDSELELCFAFDAKGNVLIEVGTSKFPSAAYTYKVSRATAKATDVKLGSLNWHAIVQKSAMSGKLTWDRADGNQRAYELSGRKATEFEGAQWKVTVTREKVYEDDEVDPPFTEVLQVRRGLLQIVDTDESQLMAEPAAFELTKKGTKSTIATGTGKHVDGGRWQLEVDGKALTGTLIERSDGDIVARCSIQGTRTDKAAPRR